jgi:precorrin isomerase
MSNICGIDRIAPFQGLGARCICVVGRCPTLLMTLFQSVVISSPHIAGNKQREMRPHPRPLSAREGRKKKGQRPFINSVGQRLVPLNLTQTLIAFFQSVVYRAVGQRPFINSVGQRPTKSNVHTNQALKGRNQMKRIAPFQGLGMWCMRVVGRCPTLLMMLFQSVVYRVVGQRHVQLNLTQTLIAFFQSVVYRAVGQRPFINSVGQRPTKSNVHTNQALKGRNQMKRIAPFQGLGARYICVVGRCPTLLMMLFQSVMYRVVGRCPTLLMMLFQSVVYRVAGLSPLSCGEGSGERSHFITIN